MKKQELLKQLRTKKKLFAYANYTDNDGGYVQIVKSDFIESLKLFSDDTEFDVTITDMSIYLN